MFEYCLLRLLEHSVFDSKTANLRLGRKRLSDCKLAIQTLLSVLAQLGHLDDMPAQIGGESALAQLAFTQAIANLAVDLDLRYAPPKPWPEALDLALSDLNQLQIHAKQALLSALIAYTFFDNEVSASESELLRVVCARLHCPMPQGAFYVYPDVTGLLNREWGGVTPTTSLELADLILDQAEVAVVPGEAFGPSGYLRLSYALGDAPLLEGVQRLQRLFA